MSWIWILILLSSACAWADNDSEVRVLLYNGSGSIRVGPLDSALEIRLESDRELFVPGQGRFRKWSPAGKGPFRVGQRIVRGKIFVRASGGRIQVLNRVDLEQYVGSTVGGEMMASWPREALRAQAVAARTYALYNASKRESADWDVLATASSQVYRGVAAESPETRAAAKATAGEILTYQGRPILSVFHSTAGGRTEAAGDVWGEDRAYLKVVEVDDEEDAPDTYWRKSVSRADFEVILSALGLGVGSLESVDVVARTRGGRAKRLRLKGSKREVFADSKLLRQLATDLELPSKLFEIRDTESGYAFVGSGHGHGVGMSQWGARAMARRGDSYKQILERFYPGARLETWHPRHAAILPSNPPSLARHLSNHGRSKLDRSGDSK